MTLSVVLFQFVSLHMCCICAMFKLPGVRFALICGPERPLQLFLTLVAFHTVERLVPFALVCTMQLHFALSYGLEHFGASTFEEEMTQCIAKILNHALL